jgi:hypothetical protein
MVATGSFHAPFHKRFWADAIMPLCACHSDRKELPVAAPQQHTIPLSAPLDTAQLWHGAACAALFLACAAVAALTAWATAAWAPWAWVPREATSGPVAYGNTELQEACHGVFVLPLSGPEGPQWTLSNANESIRILSTVPGYALQVGTAIGAQWGSSASAACAPALGRPCQLQALREAGFLGPPASLESDLLFRFNELRFRWAAVEPWTFTTSFELPALIDHVGDRPSARLGSCGCGLDLLLEGVDTLAQVLLNGRKLARLSNFHRWVLVQEPSALASHPPSRWLARDMRAPPHGGLPARLHPSHAATLTRCAFAPQPRARNALCRPTAALGAGPTGWTCRSIYPGQARTRSRWCCNPPCPTLATRRTATRTPCPQTRCDPARRSRPIATAAAPNPARERRACTRGARPCVWSAWSGE